MKSIWTDRGEFKHCFCPSQWVRLTPSFSQALVSTRVGFIPHATKTLNYTLIGLKVLHKIQQYELLEAS